LRDARATSGLLAALAADEQAEVRRQAAVALTQYPSCDAVRGLVVAALGDTATVVQRQAAVSVTYLTDGRSNPATWRRWIDTKWR
jgi:HEAT repeat protein